MPMPINTNTITPPPYQAGGFNQPTTGVTNMGFTGSPTIGQNPTIAGITNPMPQFNTATPSFNMPNAGNAVNNQLDLYRKTGFDATTQLLMAAANGSIDPSAALGATGLTPPTITTGANGIAQVSTISAGALKYILPALNPTKDPKSFITIMQKLLQDPSASKAPELQQFIPIYQQMMMSGMGGAAGMAGDPSGVLGQASQTITQLQAQNDKLIGLIAEMKGISVDELKKTLGATTTATTAAKGVPSTQD
jgi:hypothetical protein